MSDEGFTKSYRFYKPEGENAWDCVCRLSDEVGSAVDFDDPEIKRLRAHTAAVGPVSRTRMSRREFVAKLCNEAGVEGPGDT